MTVWQNAPENVYRCPSCGVDEPIVTADAAGEQTSTVYDVNGNPTDVYGPAPVACFSSDWWPSWTVHTAPVQGYLPVASPQTTPGCGVAVPHTSTGYDEGITGLAEAFWSNGQLAGAPVRHGTGEGGSQPAPFCNAATLCAQWAPGSSPVPADASGRWSLRLTGIMHMPLSGDYGFWVTASQPVTLYIDGQDVADDSPAGNPGFTPGQQNVIMFSSYDGFSFPQGMHKIELDFHGSTAQLSDFQIQWAASGYPNTGFSFQDLPAAQLSPGSNLKTSTTDPDGKTTTTSYSNSSIGPEYGLPTAVTTGAGSGTPLTTTTVYELPGPGSFLRKTSSTLAAGNTTSYTYYVGTDGPVAAACGVSAGTGQGGQLKQQAGPDPGNGQPLVKQFIYDAAGRQAGMRTGTPADIGNTAWQCTSYDSSGRVAQESFPAANGSPARTVTYAYSVGGNPLVSSVSDASGTITSTVDLLGRVTSYTDTWGQTTTTSYNQADQVTGTSGPGGSFQLGYDLNSGQPTTTTVNGVLLATASYDSAGRMNSVAYRNGTAAVIGYDALGHQNALTYSAPGGALLAEDTVTRTLAGRESVETTSQAGGLLTVSYTYDGAGRLTQAADTSGGTLVSSYSYAASPSCPSPNAGSNTNRTSVTIGTTTTSYCYNNADQLISSTSGGTTRTAFAYNERGDQTSDNGTTYSWDAADRAATATTGTTTVTSTYDPVDRLIQSTSTASGSTTVRYSYGGYTSSPAAVLSTSNNVLQQLAALPGGVTVTLQSSGNVWSYSNLQGDTSANANDSGTLTAGPVTYDPWGNLSPGQTAPVNTAGPSSLGAYAAAGKLTSTATGTILLGARTFNPAEARFLSVDPVQGGCANQYTYAFGDPLNHPDLTGRNACVDFYESYSDMPWWAGDLILGFASALAPGELVVGIGDIIGEGAVALLGLEDGEALTGAVSSGYSTAYNLSQEAVHEYATLPGGVVAITKGSPLAAPKVDKNELLAETFEKEMLSGVKSPNTVGEAQYLADCKAAGLPSKVG